MNLGDAAPVEDFIGPLIVANVPGKGRGVLVQRHVHRGRAVIRIMLKSGGEDHGECRFGGFCRFAVHLVFQKSGILDDFCIVLKCF